MNFNIELKGFKEAIQDLNPENVLKAAKKTISRAAGAGKTIISSQIREKFNIKKSDLDPKIKVDLKNIQNLEAILTVTGEPISMIHFDPTQIKGGEKLFITRNVRYEYYTDAKGKVRRRRIIFKGLAAQKASGSSGGVRVRIFKSKPILLRRAFMSHGKGGTPMVFNKISGSVSPERSYTSKKTGKLVKREKVRARRTIAYASILKQEKNLNAVINRIDEQLVKEWNQNIKHFGKL